MDPHGPVEPDDARWSRLIEELRRQQVRSQEGDRPRWVRLFGLTVALPVVVVGALVLGAIALVGGNELLPQADAPPGSPGGARRAAEAACDRPGGHLRTAGSRVVQLDHVEGGLEFQCTFVLFQWPHYGGRIWCETGEWFGPDSSGVGRPVGVACDVPTWPPGPPTPPPVDVDCTGLPPPCGMPPPPFVASEASEASSASVRAASAH